MPAGWFTREQRRETLDRAARRLSHWPFHAWYWGDAIAIDGLLEAESILPGRFLPHVLSTIERWNQYCLPNFDDALAPGAAIIQLVMRKQLPASAADRVLGRLEGLPSSYGAIPALEPHRPVFRFGLCIDALYHLPPLYALAGRWRGDAALTERGVRIALDGMRILACSSGWAQWFDPAHGRNNGVAWSRGVGWALLGLLDLLALLERPHAEIAELASTILQRLADTQETDGHWQAVLGHASVSETSTAAFYVAGCLHPAARRLESPPAETLERAVAAVRGAVAEDGTYTGASSDVLPSWNIKSYETVTLEPSPWAQGAAVRALAALVRDSD